MKRKIAIATVSLLALSACGPNYFVKGHALKPAQQVDVATAPTGALVSNNFGNSCRTPCKLPLLTARGGELLIEKEGYFAELYYIGSEISGTKVALQASDIALDAIDPEPVTIGLTAIAHMISGKGAVMDLDRREIRSELIPLPEGEEETLATSDPLTGERIPIDLSEPAS